MNKPRDIHKIVEITSDLCKFFKNRRRDLWFNFIFEFLLYGEDAKGHLVQCPFYGQYYLNVSFSAVNQISVPFAKYIVANSTFITYVEYKTKTRQGIKKLYNGTFEALVFIN